MAMARKQWRLRMAGGLAATALLAGCGGGTNTEAVTPQDFFARQPVGGIPAKRPDQPAPTETPPKPVAEAPKPLEIPKAVQTVIQSANPDNAATRPESATGLWAATEPEAAFAPGQYMTLGSLVAEVNGTPIYVNKVLRLNATTLRNLAREYDIQRFEIAARDLLEKGRDEQVDSELEYAAAERALNQSEKDWARDATRKWRQTVINQAGGSEEVARRRFYNQGLDLEEAEHDKYRQYIVEIYYYRKLWPMEMVTPDDERQFYRMHIGDYSVPDKAEIQIIEKDPDKDGQALALEHLKEYRQRALNGEDFGALATNYSDLSVNKSGGGLLQIEGDSFALAQVDKAVWKMSPGQISDVIEDNGKYYIVKLISKQNGKVTPFEDEQVQRGIQDKLETEQFKKLRMTNRERLYAESILTESPEWMDTAVQMALQNYPRWSKK
jgi:parvulin-like peptidyl-prolyl isomerase